jgi:hypothetical protein
MSDEKDEEKVAEITIITTRTHITAKRVRPANQTEAQKAA